MKRIVVILVILVVGIQFIPAKRTNPAVIYDFDGPPEVKAILQRGCYDCHSHETKWPWYSHVAPASWVVAHDVKEGREHLNFSNWEPLKHIVWIHQEIYREVAEGEMPLKAYLIAHPAAEISSEELSVLKAWAGISSREDRRIDTD